jgi:hypothetical protein
MVTALVPAPVEVEKTDAEIAALRDRIQLVITPAMFVFLLLTLGAVYFYSEFDRTTADILSTDKLIRQFRAHINVTFWSTVLVVFTAIPLGIVLTREKFRKFAPTIVGFANSGQAIPAYGLIIIFFTIMGRGTVTAIVALTVFAIIPVLRNTMVGLDQVDKATIEAARGMGMSKRGSAAANRTSPRRAGNPGWRSHRPRHQRWNGCPRVPHWCGRTRGDDQLGVEAATQHRHFRRRIARGPSRTGDRLRSRHGRAIPQAQGDLIAGPRRVVASPIA